jgi:hypothetical protein
VEPDPTKYLPLTTAEFQILLSLAGGELHGYAIMQDVAAATQGKVRLGPGTLYRSIKGLLVAGLGRRVAAAEAARLDELVIQAYSRLGLSRGLNKSATGRASK